MEAQEADSRARESGLSRKELDEVVFERTGRHTDLFD